MRSRSRPPGALRLALALLLAACGGGGVGAQHDPRPGRLEPSWGETRVGVPVVLHGENFVRLLTQRVDRTPALEARDAYQLLLDGTALEAVQWVDEQTLSAVVPAGLAAGWHALEVVSPLGRRVTLERAYYASATAGARLAVSARVEPDTVSVGQASQLTLSVENTGGTPALGVTPSVTSVAGPPVQLTALSGPRDLAPGQRADFAWRAVTTATGQTVLRFAFTAREAGSDRPLDQQNAATETLTTLTPATLVAQASATPTQVSVGQEVRARLVVRNDGQVEARAVTPQLVQNDPPRAQVLEAPAPANVGPGNSRTFEWRLQASAAGTLRLTASASATDALSGVPVGATAPDVTVVIQTAPTLQGTLVAPPTVSTGQAYTLSLTLRNTGEVAALGVTPDAPVPAGTGTFDVLTSPPAQDVPGGQTRTFSWGCRARDPGDLDVNVVARGQDANGAGEVASAPAHVTMQVQAAAALAAEATQPPPRVSVGYAFALDVAVRNAGDATALAVRPSLGDLQALGLEALSEPAPRDVAGHASATFNWTLVARTEGTPELQLSASGTDANTTEPAASAPPVPLAVAAERPAALAVSARAARTQWSVGEELEVSLDVSNTGTAATLGVTADAPLASGTGTLALLLSPAAQDVPGGEARTFTWRYRADAAGTAGLALRVEGRDANSTQPVAASASAPTLTLQRPAALTASASAATARMSTGQTQTLSLTVENTGEALARAVAPLAPAFTGDATLTVLGTPAPQDVPGGEARTFAWVVRADAAGSADVQLSAQGRDGNSDAAVGAEASVGVQVQTAALLTASAQAAPARVSVGQDVTLTLLVSNAGEAAATGLALPAPVATGTAGLTLTSEPGALDVAGQSSQPFSWTLHAETPGRITLAARATAQDVNSGARLDTGLASAGEVLVESPAQLRVALSASPAAVNEGGPVRVDVTVFNDGEALARGVTVAAAPVPGGTSATPQSSAPAAFDLAGGASQAFTFDFAAGSTGTLRFEARAQGTDGNSGLAVAALPATSSDVAVRRAAALTAALEASLPASGKLSVGQAFTLTERVTNTGESSALAVTPAGLVVLGGASVVSSPAAQDVPGGVTRDFHWTLSATAPGTLELSAGAAGTDGTDGTARQAAAVSAAPILVQAAAQLSATATVSPAQVSTGQTVTFTLQVSNAGEATATGLALPGLVSSGTAGFTLLTSPAPSDVAGRSSRAFTWTLRAESAGPLQLGARATGQDANSGAALDTGVANAGGLTVQTPARLRVTVTASPDAVNEAGALQVDVTVVNEGQALARGVTAAASPAPGGASATPQGPAPAAVDLPGGMSQRFSFAFAAGSAGTLRFEAGAQATDGNSGLVVTAPTGTSNDVVVRRAAQLAAAASAPARVSVGQAFDVTLAVSNTGESGALGVVPGTPALGGTGGASTGALPEAQDVPGGAVRSFRLPLTATRAGDLTVTASASGTDATDGAARTSAPAAASLLVQRAATLSALASASPAQVSLGQTVTFTLQVTNAGEADAVAVALPTPSVSGTGVLSPLTTPSPASVPGGATRSFTWTYRADGAGPVTLAARATAQDANSGAPLDSGLATAPAVTLQTPAQLTLAASASPTAVNEGGALQVVVTATNPGGATLRAVAPSLSVQPSGAASLSAPAPAAQDVPGGQSRTFTFQYAAGSAGSASFAAQGSGTDGNSGATVSAGPVQSNAVTVRRAAQLTASAALSRAQVSVSQALTLTLSVTNAGDSRAVAVAPTAYALTGTATATAGAWSPASQDVAGGATASFTRTLTPTSAGSLAVSVAASGTDGTDASVVSAPAASAGPATVQTAAALTASLQVPAQVTPNVDFTVTLTVTNTGQASALGVTPDVPTASGLAAPERRTDASPASASIAGGSSATFTWTYRVTSSGTFTVRTTARGTDGNSGVSVASAEASASGSSEVQQLATNPTGDGATFAWVFGYGGRVYVGPSASGRGGARFNPDGTGAESFTFRIARDSANTGLNTATDPDGTYPSIGAKGCTLNTLACGPDNEDGRGLFFSGTFADGSEWLGVMGARTSTGGYDYIYFTQDADSVLDFRFANINTATGGNTRTPSAAYFLNGLLYVGGVTVTGGGPQLAVVKRGPPAWPGLAYASPGDLENFQAKSIPAVGNNADTTKGYARNPSTIVGIDAMVGFNNRLYVANNGGVARSKDAVPGSANTDGNWIDSTPSSWVVADSLTVLDRELTPGTKTVAAMAAWGGRLYLARNTKNGPQLYVCTPAKGGSATDCDPGDWTQLGTTFNDTNNKALSLLVATSNALYVGFDNPVGGVNLFRTTLATPATAADFTGQAGCAASLSTCKGLGGQGLGAGAGVTQVFSSVALTASGKDWVYLSAGTGSGAVGVYRLGL